MRILVVEDDPKISKFIAQGLSSAGFVVDEANDGQEALTLLLDARYDLAVMDLMLPGLDGLSVIEKVREKRIHIPVIILSAKHSVDDKILGLQKGGDDYMVKPFSMSELLARVHALLRRPSEVVEPTNLVKGDISLDLLTREVNRQGKRVDLQPKEITLLEYFMRNSERVLSKSFILERVWNYNFDPQTNAVDVLVCRLRNKIDKGFERKTIQTIRGLGYVFKPS